MIYSKAKDGHGGHDGPRDGHDGPSGDHDTNDGYDPRGDHDTKDGYVSDGAIVDVTVAKEGPEGPEAGSIRAGGRGHDGI